MAAPSDPLAVLESSLGPERTAKVARRLLRAPYLLDWLQDDAVAARFAAIAGTGEASPMRALLAATGVTDLDTVPDPLPARLAARRKELLEATLNAEPYAGSPEDTLAMARELVLAGDVGGAAGIRATLAEVETDWRTPLACAWEVLPSRHELVREIVRNPRRETLAALVCALRSNLGDDEAARALQDARADAEPDVLSLLVETGEIGFAKTLAESLDGRKSSAREAEPGRGLQEALASGWESRRAGLAEWADSIAAAAESNGDLFGALEARRQALRIEPTETRLAALAVTHVLNAEPSEALSLLPPDPESPELKAAVGMAFVSGGAIEKGRPLLVEAAAQMLREETPIAFAHAVVRGLRSAGESALALDLLRAHLAINPGDDTARQDLARTLFETGQAETALGELCLLRALGTDLPGDLTLVEGRALLQVGHARKALPSLRASLDSAEPGGWKEMTACAIEADDAEVAQAFLAAPPPGVDAGEVAVLRARLSSLRGEPEEAEKLLVEATLAHPSSEAPWLGLATAQQTRGRAQDAGETLRRAVQLLPTSAPIHAAFARWLRDADRPSEALEAARAAERIRPGDPEARFETGMAHLGLGSPQQAVEPLREAHRALPGRLDIRLALAEALEASGEAGQASRLLSHLPDTAPASVWLASGRLMLNDDETAPAVASEATGRILRARALGASGPEIDYWLGLGFELSGEPGRAAEAYSGYLSRSPREMARVRRATIGKAACLVKTGNPADSLHDLEVARSKFAGDPEILGALARAYLAASLTDEALQVAQAVLQQQPAHREALAVLTEAAQRTGTWTVASAAVGRAAREIGDDAGLWVESAEAASRCGDPDEAGRAVEKALSLDPDAGTRRRAALLLVELGDPPRALDLLNQAASQASDDPEAWIEIADVAARAGEKSACVDALARAVTLRPEDPELHVRNARALWDSDRRSESIGAWMKALELHPDDVLIHGSLASALVCNGEMDAGFDEFARALHSHPVDARLLAQAGTAHLRHGSLLKAIELLQAADEAEPGRTDVALGLAEAWLRSSRPEKAIVVLDGAGDAAASDSMAWSLRTEASLATGDLPGAEEAIVRARSLCGGASAERIALARAELRFGHWKHAVDALAMMMADGDRDGEAALAEAIVRGLEARWLYAVAGSASARAPQADFPGGPASDWLEKYVAQGADPDRHLAERMAVLHPDGAHDEALAGLLSACSNQDCHSEAREALAIALLKEKRPLDALQALKPIEPDDLGPDWQAILAGVAHAQAGNRRLAKQAFDDAARDAGLRPLALTLHAQVSLEDEDQPAAISALNQALIQWPDEPAWQSKLAQLYVEAGTPDSALPHLQHAADLLPDDPQTQLAFAHGLRQSGLMKDALTAYENSLRLRPEEPEVWFAAGEAAVACADFEKAETSFSRAVDLEPSRPEFLLGHARAALALGKTREAHRRAQKALQVGGEGAQTLECLAEIASHEGDHDRAIELIERACTVADDPARLRKTHSRLLVEAGRASDAADVLRLHLSENDADEAAWLALGEALEISGDLNEASRAVETAIRLSPRSAKCRVSLARVSRKAGQLDRALDELHQAESLDPLNPQVALELGRVHESRRELDHALEAYRRSTEIDPEFAEAFRRAGSVLKSLKAYEDAGRMLARAVELEPSDAATLQQLAAVRALELVHGETFTLAVQP